MIINCLRILKRIFKGSMVSGYSLKFCHSILYHLYSYSEMIKSFRVSEEIRVEIVNVASSKRKAYRKQKFKNGYLESSIYGKEMKAIRNVIMLV